MDLPFNIYLTLATPAFASAFASKWTPTRSIVRPEATLFIWENLDWMACHLDYANLEQGLALLPNSEYHLICYGDAYDEAGEGGELNIFDIQLTRSVKHAAT